MKNKTKTYVLIVLVLGIWGLIGYRVLSAVNPKEPTVPQQYVDVAFHPKAQTATDTFSIQKANRDPFLGTLLVKKEKQSIKKVQVKTTVEWPQISYQGHIAQQKGKAEIFIVSINGRQQLMKTGQILDGVKLVHGTEKAIALSYKGIRKTIQKI